FLRAFPGRGFNVEKPFFFEKFRDKKYLKQYVSKLLADIFGVAGFNGRKQFMGLFDEIYGYAFGGLLPVPRAAVFASQGCDDPVEPFDGVLVHDTPLISD